MLEIIVYTNFQNSQIETLHTNCMIHGEVGKLPLQVSVDKLVIAYWLRVLNKDLHTFAYTVYMIVLNLTDHD